MAVHYLSSVVGDDATADGTKTLPYETIGAVPFGNGDTVLVDSRHFSRESITGPSALSGPPVVVTSVDWSTGTGAADESYLEGAIFQRASGLTIRGALHVYGITFWQESNSYWLEIGKDYHTDFFAVDCVLHPGPNTPLLLSGPSGSTFYTSRIRLIDCQIDLDPDTEIRGRWGSQIEIVACRLTGNPGTASGVLRPYECDMLVDGLDISSMTSGALLWLDGNGKLTVRNTPLPGGVALIGSGGIGAAYQSGAELLYLDTAGSQHVVQREGWAATTTGVYRSGGATLSGGSPVSSLASTEAGIATSLQSLSYPIDRRILDLSAPRTLRVYVAQAGGLTALHDGELWLEVRYRRASDGQARVVRTCPAAPHLPTAALPTDSASTWTGLTTPVAQYVEAVIPADAAGDSHAEIRVHVSRPGAAVYVDPSSEVV